MRSLLVLIVCLGVAVAAGCSSKAYSARHYLDIGKKLLAERDYPRAILELRNAAQADPKDPEPHYQLGLAYLATGEGERAIVAFRKAIEVNPKHAGAQKHIAEVMLTTRDAELLSEAGTRMEKVLEADPADSDAMNLLAMSELKQGREADAEQRLQKALNDDPTNVRTYVNLASLNMARKNVGGAEELLKQATMAVPRSVDAWMSLGQFYAVTGKPAEAEAQYQKAVEIDPNSARAILTLGTIQASAGQTGKAAEMFKRLTTLSEPQYKTVYGRYLYSAGKTEAAVAEFERLAQSDTGNREYRTLLVSAYVNTKRQAEALKILDAVLEKSPKNVEARLQRAEIEFGAGNLAKARPDIESALRDRPESPAAHYLMAQVHQMDGNEVARREELAKALERRPALLPARIELAGSLSASRNYSGALAVLEGTPEEHKSALAVRVERNWALIGAGKLAEARKGVDAALASARLGDVLVQDAMLKLHARQIAAGRAAVEEALKANPRDVRAVQVLVASYLAEQQPAKAIAAAKPYLTRLAESFEAQTYLGELLLASGDREGARAAFTAASRLRPEQPAAQLMLAQMDAAEGKPESARATLKALLAANRGVEQAALLLGDIEQRTSGCANAVELYRKSVEANSRNWVSQNNLAACLNDTGNHEEALKFAQQAKELNPKDPAVADTLGWALYNKGIYSAAVRELERYADKSNAVHQYHLAMAHMKNGQVERGRAVLENARKVNPELEEAKMAEELYQEVSQNGR